MSEAGLDHEILSYLPMPIWVLRWENPPDITSFRILSANPAAASILSVPLAEVIGKRLGEAFPRLLETIVPSLCADVLTQGDSRSVRQLLFSDHNVPHAAFDVHAIPLDSGRLALISEVTTERWELETRLRRTEMLMQHIQKAAHVGTFHWDAVSDHVSWSAGMHAIYALTAGQFAGTLEAFLACIHPDDRAAVQHSIDAAIQAGGEFGLTERIIRPNGETRKLESVGMVDQDTSGRFIGLYGACVDVTEVSNAITDLAQSEERFRLLVDKVTDYAIFMLDVEGRVMSWNAGAARIKGYRAEEIIGQSIARFYTPEDAQRQHHQELLAQAKRDGRVEEEGWRVRKDGTRFWADVLITALRDESGQLRGYGKVTRDLSERHNTQLALGELSARLMQNQDSERRRLAIDLHDSTSPLLTGLTAKLYALRQLTDKNDTTQYQLIEDALANAEATRTVVRTVSSLLHPPLLDESGLLPSLRWYLDVYSRRTEVKVDVDFPVTLPRLPRDMEIALFRVAQEAVSTILQQAGSRQIQVKIDKQHDRLEMVFSGDGRELSPTMQQELRLGRGDAGIALAGMRERMRQLNGTLEFDVAQGKPRVKASLPIIWN